MKIGVQSRVAKWEPEASIEVPEENRRRSSMHDLASLVLESLPRGGSAVLAVSGGLDSMTLLDVAAMVRQRRGCALVVATFDHGSGPHSERAAALVSRSALQYGVPVVLGRAEQGERTEA